MGFGHKWSSWIRALLSSARASVLVNGSPTNEFIVHRGLRQGDPLSPFLFILAMEGLHMAIHRAREANVFRGIRIGGDEVEVSHFSMLMTRYSCVIGLWIMRNAFLGFYVVFFWHLV